MTEATMPRHPTTIRLEVERAFADHRLIEYSIWEIEALERKLTEEQQEHKATLSLARESREEIERLRGVISDVTNERDLLVRSINTPIADVRTENYRLKLERDQLVSMDNAAMDKMQAMIREQSERIAAVASYAELLRENLEILHDAMCIAGGLTHTQGDNYAASPRCEIVMKLLAETPNGGNAGLHTSAAAHRQRGAEYPTHSQFETCTKSYVATTLDSINSAIGAINAGHPEVAADFLRAERSRHQSCTQPDARDLAIESAIIALGEVYEGDTAGWVQSIVGRVIDQLHAVQRQEKP